MLKQTSWLVLALAGGCSDAATDAGTLGVLFGDGTGQFAPATEVGIAFLPRTLACADFDGDGRPDIAATGYGDRVGLAVASITGAREIVRAQFEVAVDGIELASGDLDGDGVLDLVAGSLSELSMLRGRGDGTFERLAPPVAASVHALALLPASAGSQSPLIAVAQGLGNANTQLFAPGAVEPSRTLDAPVGATALAAVDLDADGLTDLVSAHGRRPEGLVVFHRAQPDGSFVATEATIPDELPLVVHATGDSIFIGATGTGQRLALGPDGALVDIDVVWQGTAYGFASGDFDEDARTDVVVVGTGSPPVALLRDVTATAPMAPTPVVADGDASAVCAADFDGDGHLDLAVANGDAASALY